MTTDVDYLLALAEEAQMQREALYRERTREAKMARRAKLCDRLRAEIRRLMFEQFSWQRVA